MALRDTNAPLLQLPGRRRGVRVGREKESRTVKYPALVICTRSADTQCVVCWILGKQNSKTYERVPAACTTGTKGRRVISESLIGTGASPLDGSIPAYSTQQLGILGNFGHLSPLGSSTALKSLTVITASHPLLLQYGPTIAGEQPGRGCTHSKHSETPLQLPRPDSEASLECTDRGSREEVLRSHSHSRAYPVCLPLPTGLQAAPMAAPPVAAQEIKTEVLPLGG